MDSKVFKAMAEEAIRVIDSHGYLEKPKSIAAIGGYLLEAFLMGKKEGEANQLEMILKIMSQAK